MMLLLGIIFTSKLFLNTKRRSEETDITECLEALLVYSK